MPFATGEFDLVLNRHSAFNSAEVARVLASGGTFLIQQVHGCWAEDLMAEFGATPQWPESSPDKYVPRLPAADLEAVDVREWTGKLAFTDLGAIVYYLKAVPWLVSRFSVATHLADLLRLQARAGRSVAAQHRARRSPGDGCGPGRKRQGPAWPG
jgi:hypothetical protein